MTLAEDLNVQRLKVASDCVGVVNDINSGTRGLHSAVVYEIIERRNSLTLCSFIHEHRKHNFEARNLVKFACNLNLGRHIWFGNPRDPNRVPMNILLDE